MSSVSELLAELRGLHVSLSAHDGKLKITGQASALTPALKERIVAHKPALLALLGDVATTRPTAARSALQRREGDAPRPLSYVQERIWFIERINPGTALHNIGLALRWRGALDRARLAEALTLIVQRHDVLRARIVTRDDGTPCQRIVPPAPVALTINELAADALPSRLEALLAEPFALADEPLVRFRLLALGDDDHALVVIAHHIVWDGRSSDVFRDELVALYDALVTGQTPALPALAVGYADFAEHLRSASEQGAFARELAYWQQTFTPLPEPLDVPADHPRALLRSGQGDTVSTRFEPGLVAALRALAKAQHATLQMVLLAALDVLLARISGQPDVVVGSAYDQRELPELDRMIGCFVNTLALRTKVDADESFTDLLARVRQRSLDALAHRDVPFERVVEALAPPRDTSRTPLYQVMFSYQERPSVQQSPRGVRLDELTLPTGGAATDLFLWVGNRESELHAVLDYASDLFARETAERLLSTFATLLAGIVREPAQPVGRLPLVSASEQAALLRINPLPEPRTITGRVHALIEAQAARTPDATALVFEDAALSYRELDARANRLAHHLAARGIGAGALVGVSLARGLDLPIALLAVIKTGAAYVPLDPSYPRERLRGMVDDARLALIVTDRSADALFADTAVARVVLEDEAAQIAAASSANLATVGDARDAMYVIYTSGSTGKPKGVVVEHQNVTNFLAGMRARLSLADGGCWVSATSVSFDISVLEIFGALSHGFKLVLIGTTHAGLAADARYGIAQQIERHSATHFQCTPSQALILLADQAARRALRGLRELLVGGEALGRDVADQLLDNLSGRLLNMYGPTETTIWSSTSEVTRDGAISLGRPIVNTTFVVVDAAGQLVPRGVVGELCIGGLGVTRGYLERDALTRERFVVDPFSPLPDARLYRTGDLVRLRNDDSIAYVGRNDFQVKIRGYRIELGEIESALRSHPALREVAVIARTDAGADPQLVAYVVGDHAADPDALRAHLTGAGLPDYMLPQAFVALERLPVTGSGKLDRNALPAPAASARAATARYVAPRGPTEELLASVFAALFNTAQVSADDSFFGLGGHSLLALRLVTQLRDALGFELPMVLVFSHPRLRDLARAIDAQRGASAPVHALPISTRTEAPLSFAQERLWFLDQLSGRGAQHNLALTLRIDGTLDVAALTRALEAVVKRQESLRTRTRVAGGVPTLEVTENTELALARHDLSSAPDPHAALREALDAFTSAPLDLDAGPWLRVGLFTLSAGAEVLCAVGHHATWDGTSLGIFQRELGAAYEAALRDEAPSLPALPARYVDYTAWERQLVGDGVYDAQIAFWKQQLAGAPTLDFPSDKPRPQLRSGQGAVARLPLDEHALAQLDALARAEHATMYMALVALLDVLALRFAGATDVVIAAPVDGRVRPELTGLIGMFVNTVLLRVELTPELTFRELLKRVRGTALTAFSHAEVPFDRVVQAIEPPRDTSRTALYQLMFSYLEQSDQAARFAGLPAHHVELASHEATTDLMFYIPDHGDRVTVHLEYATDLFEPATAQRLLRAFSRMLAFAAAQPDAKLADFPALDHDEHQRLLVPLADNPQVVPEPLRIDQRFAEQVARTPDARALVFRDRTLTYRALDERANQLAHVLRARGAARDRFVGVCMRRSESLVIALLAVIKAGAAYLPLDPVYPEERLRYMVDDAGAQLVLVEADTAALMHGTGAALLSWDELAPQIATQPSTPPVIDGDARDLMYVIYTSGSTGKPKGVMVEHRNVANLLTGMRETLSLEAPGSWLGGTSMSFDISVLEIFGTLTHGLTLIFMGAGTPASEGTPALPEPAPYDIASSLVRHQITHYQCTPSQALLLLGDPAARAALGNVQEMLIGGEALTVDLAIKLQEHLGGRLINLYGPTETTVWSTCWPVPRQPSQISLGMPIANTALRVLDAHQRPVPVGVTGELYIGGLGVTRGYLGRDELTRERFVPDSFADAQDARMYRTGDLVRVRNDGSLAYLGRNDFQVKLRGFRIELGEIEDALRRLAGAREAVVVARDDGQGDARLIAYVIAGDATPRDLGTLRAALRAELPDYMVPAAIVMLDAFPLTGSGKVDRARLPAPAVETSARSASTAQPTSELEQRIADCWRDILKTAHVGLDDNFFDLGGHSLLMGRLADAISSAVARPLTIPELFQFPSVRALARHLGGPSANAQPAPNERAAQRRAAPRNVQGRRG